MSIRALLASLIFVFFASTASAQVCNFSITNFNFGNINLGPGGTAPTSGTFTAICSGKPGQTITICPNIGAGSGGSNSGSPRLLTNGTSSIPYNLLQPNGQVWGSFVWPYAPRAPVLSVTLGAGGTATLTQNIQAVIAGSIAAAPTGTYSSTFRGLQTVMDYGYAPAYNCAAAGLNRTRMRFRVHAQVTATCNLAVNAMSFGTIAGLTTAQATSNQIGLTCTRGVPYTISLSNGSNGGTGPATHYLAAPGVTQKLSYGIYKDVAHIQPWGSTTGSNTQAGIGNGTTQNITAYANLPAQGNPVPGIYSDAVIVTVNY